MSDLRAQPTTRKAVVSYRVGASDQEKHRALLDGLRDCAAELVELIGTEDTVRELEQITNDVEVGDVV